MNDQDAIFKLEYKDSDSPAGVATITNLTLPEIYENFPRLIEFSSIITQLIIKPDFGALAIRVRDISFILEWDDEANKG